MNTYKVMDVSTVFNFVRECRTKYGRDEVQFISLLHEFIPARWYVLYLLSLCDVYVDCGAIVAAVRHIYSTKEISEQEVLTLIAENKEQNQVIY